MAEGPKNFQALWKTLAATKAENQFVRVPVPSSKSFLTYRIHSFYNRALRVSHAFASELRMRPGDGVAVLSNWPHDLALVAHGAWLGRYFVAPISAEMSESFIVSILNHTQIKAVVFAAEDTSKALSLMSKVTTDAVWIATGIEPGKRLGNGIRRFDEVISQAPRVVSEPANPSNEDSDALIAITSGSSGRPRGVWFSQSALLQAAQAAAKAYPPQPAEGNIWSLIPHRSMLGLMHGYVIPLFTGTPCIIDPTFDMADFWEQLRANEVTYALLDQSDFRVITRRGKPRTWKLPESLHLGLFTSTAFSMESLAAFEKRFNVPVLTHYAITEAGGTVAAMPLLGVTGTKKWFFDFEVPSSGSAISGVELKVVATDGSEVEPEETGEILIRSKQIMKSYVAVTPGTLEIDEDGFLRTGDEGFFIDEDGQNHVFIRGRASELIPRGDVKVNPYVIENLIYDISGIEYVCVVGFPNVYTGFEVGAFVVLKTLSTLTEKEILSTVRAKMDWFHCPKVVVFGERGEIGEYPTRAGVVHRFDQFENVDYSRNRYKI